MAETITREPFPDAWRPNQSDVKLILSLQMFRILILLLGPLHQYGVPSVLEFAVKLTHGSFYLFNQVVRIGGE